jgi:hypothetical protein
MIQTNYKYRISALRTTHSVQYLELLLVPSYYSTTLAEVDRSKMPDDRMGYQAYGVVLGQNQFHIQTHGLVTMLYKY